MHFHFNDWLLEVSIIIPAYNAAKFIGRALNAAVASARQVNGRVEILAIDNNSADDTLSQLHGIAERHPGLIKVQSCIKPGACAARNQGLRSSSGKWIQYLDADDTIHPDKIAHQLAVSREASWVVGGYRHCFADGEIEDVLPSANLWKGLYHGFQTGHTISNLIQRSTLEKVGGWNEDLASNQDPELHFRLLKASTPYVLDNQVYSYYYHDDRPERIINTLPGKRYASRLRMLMEANDYLKKERPAIWELDRAYFLGATLVVLRQLATYDLAAAERAYDQFLTGSYSEDNLPRLELVSQYTRLYPYLGFRNLERLRLALAGVIPQELKRILKS
ncbi:MAG: glycosyltransferase family 2 protein [Lewinella sp.]